MNDLTPGLVSAVHRLRRRQLVSLGAPPNERADQATAELASAFAREGIPFILLKGASFTRRLYEDPSERLYEDADILVRPDRLVNAEQALVRLGYKKNPLTELPGDKIPHARTWVRSRDAAVIDLHQSITGANAPPAAIWLCLEKHLCSLGVGGVEVNVLDDAGLALLVGLHSAHHGHRWGRPQRDLERAIETLADATWLDAARLARDLAATPAFAAGLRLTTNGRALAQRLSLPEETTTEVLIRASDSEGQLALGLDWFVSTPGWRNKLRLAWVKLFPPREFIRAWLDSVGRSDLGLTRAYLWRPLWLLRRLPASYAKWRTARSRAHKQAK